MSSNKKMMNKMKKKRNFLRKQNERKKKFRASLMNGAVLYLYNVHHKNAIVACHQVVLSQVDVERCLFFLFGFSYAFSRNFVFVFIAELNG